MGKRRKWLIGGTAGLAVCLGGFVFGTPYIDVVQAANSLEAEVKRAKALGNPLTSSELILNPPSRSENAASDLKQILAEPLVEQLATEGRDAQDAVARGDYKGAEGILKPWQLSLQLARKAAQKPKLMFEREWDATMDLQFPEYEPVKGLVRAMCAQAECDYRSGRRTEGDENLKAAFAIGHLVGQEPTIISALVEVLGRTIAVRTVESLVGKNRSDEDALGRLANVVVVRPLPDVKNNLRAEMFFGTAVIRNLDKYGGFNQLERYFSGDEPDPDAPRPTPPDVSELRKEGLPTSLTDRAFLARHLHFWNGVLEAATATDDLNAFSDLFEEKIKKLESEKGLSYAFDRLTFPVYGAAFQSLVRCQASESTMRGLIEVLRFRKLKGRYPSDLAEAGFKEIDPFSGQPLKLYVKDDVVRVYSVGPNKKDENGRSVETGGETTSPMYDDIAARTDRPVRMRPAKPRSNGNLRIPLSPADPLPNSRTASPPLSPPR